MNNFYLVWISLIKELENKTFIKLLCPLNNSLKDFYNLTKDSQKFILYLKSNKIFLSKHIFMQFVNCDIKKRAYILYKFISRNNIQVITSFSKTYKDVFKSDFQPVFYSYGNIDLLKKKKYYVYSEKNSNKVLNIEKKFKSFIINSQKILIEKYKDPIYNEKCIYIGDYLDMCNSKTLSKKNLYLFMNSNNNVIPQMLDRLVIINAKYKKEIVNMVDNSLEYGKDVLVVPNDIFSSSSYFSNYLIYEGASVILSEKDL